MACCTVGVVKDFSTINRFWSRLSWIFWPEFSRMSFGSGSISRYCWNERIINSHQFSQYHPDRNRILWKFLIGPFLLRFYAFTIKHILEERVLFPIKPGAFIILNIVAVFLGIKIRVVFDGMQRETDNYYRRNC